jgi:hypothetical protein
LDDIVQPYEKIDLNDITTRLNKLQDIKNIPVIPAYLNQQWETVKTNCAKIPNLVSDLNGLNIHMNYFDNVLDLLKKSFHNQNYS